MQADEKQTEIRDIIDGVVQRLIDAGATRPVALHLLAYQSVLRLCIDQEFTTLAAVRDQINADIENHLTPRSDETLQ